MTGRKIRDVAEARSLLEAAEVSDMARGKLLRTLLGDELYEAVYVARGRVA